MNMYNKLKSFKNETDFDNLINDETLKFNSNASKDIVVIVLNNKFVLICNVSDYNLVTIYLNEMNLLIDKELYIKIKDISNYFSYFHFDRDEFNIFLDYHSLLKTYHREDVLGNQVVFDTKIAYINFYKDQFKKEQVSN